MKTICSIAIAALLIASPALASPQEDGACVVGRLSDADVSAIVEETMAGGSNETLSRLRGPLETCSAGRNWTPARGGNASAYAIGLVVRRTLGERLVEHGIDAFALNSWFTRQSDAFRTTAFTTMDEAAREAAFATLVDHEVSAEAMERDGAIIGGYVSALVIIERIDRGLGM
jgi:hypothetical protein